MIVSNSKRNSENLKTLMLILAMENPVLHQMHGKQYLPYLFTSRFRIFSKNSKSSFLKSHKYMNSFMRAHLTSSTAETKPIYASKKNFCLIKPLNVCVCAGVGYLASFFSSTTRDTVVQSSRYFEQWGYNLAWAVFALSQI